jgi:polar amino acid transport system permease protein
LEARGVGFRPSVVIDNAGLLLQGIWLTIALSLSSIAIGLILGAAGAALRRSRIRVIRLLVAGYVEIFRSTPSLVQLYFFFFGLPSLGLRLNPLPASLLSLGLYTGAYCTEIIRAGIESVPRGQLMASRSLGLTDWQTFRYVVAPQAVRAVMPPLANQVIDTTLTSSLASLVGLYEVTQQAVILVSKTFRPFEIYLTLGAIYLGITIVLVVVFAMIERYFGIRRRIHILPTDVDAVLKAELDQRL